MTRFIAKFAGEAVAMMAFVALIVLFMLAAAGAFGDYQARTLPTVYKLTPSEQLALRLGRLPSEWGPPSPDGVPTSVGKDIAPILRPKAPSGLKIKEAPK